MERLCSASLSPVERIGDVWLKRDDLYEFAGVRGGKVRTCAILATRPADVRGLVTAGSRASPQVNIVAHIARELGLPCRVHTPTGKLSPEVEAAAACGAVVVQHRAGYNNVIIARAREDAAALGWVNIPFGMECKEAIIQTSLQVENVPYGTERIVVPVGSGMSLAGVLWGLGTLSWTPPVLGVIVGADPTKRLDKWAPKWWREKVELVRCPLDYHKAPSEVWLEEVKLDGHYEAKCLPYLRAGDLFWCVGIRQTAVG